MRSLEEEFALRTKQGKDYKDHSLRNNEHFIKYIQNVFYTNGI